MSTAATARNKIPVDVLRAILDHTDTEDLVTICQLNKICCSCSQDALYRDIQVENHRRVQVFQTLTQSTHLAQRVRSFLFIFYEGVDPEIMAKALQNMSSLRSLTLHTGGAHSSILDKCPFKLDSFSCDFPYDQSLRNFLNGQPSLTSITFVAYNVGCSGEPFEATCLPNLSQVTAEYPWLQQVIRGRPVSDVTLFGVSIQESLDLSFFTLSTAPIRKLGIDYSFLFPKPGLPLASIFPALVHLEMVTRVVRDIRMVRRPILIF
jgi:hypothetical protein